MTRLTLDSTVSRKLDNLNEQLELCDDSGRTLGYFLPVNVVNPPSPSGIRSPISDEELDRRRNEPGGCTLAEFWARMGRS